MASDDFSARWEQRIRDHGHQVFLSLLAQGIAPEPAREVVQATWARLMEKDRAGQLSAGSFLGLAITQARFLALDMRRAQARRGSHEPVEDHHELPASSASNPEELAVSRQELERVRLALADCPATAQKIFRLAYTPPPRDHRAIAEAVGLSLQRVRQILSETRKRLRVAIAESQASAAAPKGAAKAPAKVATRADATADPTADNNPADNNLDRAAGSPDPIGTSPTSASEAISTPDHEEK